MLIVLLAATAVAAPFEAWQGVEIGNSRMLGMGGAFLGVAEGTRAALDNPAALAVRRPANADEWDELGFTFGTAGLGALSGFDPGDLDEDFPQRRLRLGSALRLGPTGLGAFVESLGYAFEGDPSTPGFNRVEHGTVSVGAGRAFADGELVVGVLAVLYFSALTSGEEDFLGRNLEDTAFGPGALVGALWAPERSPWRVGVRVRPYGRTLPNDDEPPVLDIRWPAELGVGVAWQTGVERNLPATYGEGPGYDRLGRYLLVAADVDVLGPSEAAALRDIALEDPPVGAPATVAFHLGAEAEVTERLLRVRAGVYTRPARQDDQQDRLHGTAGLGLYVGRFPVIGGLRVSPAVDVSQDWYRFSFGVGPW